MIKIQFLNKKLKERADNLAKKVSELRAKVERLNRQNVYLKEFIKENLDVTKTLSKEQKKELTDQLQRHLLTH